MCFSCGKRTLERTNVDQRYVIGGRRRLVRGVPALMCTACGQRFFDHVAASWVDTHLGLGRVKRRRRAA